MGVSIAFGVPGTDLGGNMPPLLPLCVTTWGSSLTSKCAVGNRDGVRFISL